MQTTTSRHTSHSPATSALHYLTLQKGVTLLELVVALTLVTILSAVAVPRAQALRNRLAVRAAANDADALFAKARRLATATSSRASVVISPSTASLYLLSNADTITRRPEGTLHGVTLTSSRTSTVYSPTGAAVGGSNLTLVFMKGTAAETLFVSRLGRVRR